MLLVAVIGAFALITAACSDLGSDAVARDFSEIAAFTLPDAPVGGGCVYRQGVEI
jgi:hypothetical protein